MEEEEEKRKRKGRCRERREKNHARNTQITVMWKKRMKQQKKWEIGLS